MSWFDTSSLANIAKTALKEAQRTIDKALDIQEDAGSAPSNLPLDTNSEDFFDSWGVKNNVPPKEIKSNSLDEVVTKSPSKSKLSSSIWGSFSGSFFDYPKETTAAANENKNLIECLDDSNDIGEEHFKKSKLVVQQSDDDFFQTISSSSKSTEPTDGEPEKDKSQTSSIQVIEEKGSNYDSSKDTSENVENISGDTDYMKTPDSELVSPGFTLSASSSEFKDKSQSVEVLTDSLASPSSVEVLTTDPTNSRQDPNDSNDNESPSLILDIEEQFQTKSDHSSPDSVEVIPENADECSIVEDTVSFASASERTVLESDLYSNQYLPCNNQEKFSPISEGTSDILSKPVETQPHHSTKDVFPPPVLMKNSNVIDIPLDGENLQENHFDDDGSQSDRTIIASTENIMESSSDTASTSTEQNANSSYFKTMIADAMTEKDQTKEDSKDVKESVIDMSISQLELREVSSVSSESRSDLVKIESDQASGHTSGDEIETTTSSDIEIISSPNGDSSSNHSRHSPAKISCIKQKCSEANVDALLGKMTFKKIKGHNRELSEASSVSDDSSEIDRLVKRINEMTEILEYRETKLVEINRNYLELQEINANLQKQLDTMMMKQMESADLSQVTEEYTRRMSVLEKKFQQAIREKDHLNKQVEHFKQEAASRVSKGELDGLINEKDEIIKELREEGEKLSKQQLQHSNIIKKLRVKEKEHEGTIKKLRDNIEDLSSENDRLKRSLAAKDEVEHSQIEAVHQLTARNKKLEYDVTQLQSQIEDVTQKYETVKKSLDAAKKELTDKTRTYSELQHKQQMLKSLENEKRMTESQNEEILAQIEDLRTKLQEAEQEMLKREQQLKNENNELLRRLEAAEARNEELAQSVVEATKPLVRQLEVLQATHSMKIANYEKIEQELTSTIQELQSKIQTTLAAEKAQREECHKHSLRLSLLESQLATAEHQVSMLSVDIEQVKTEKIMLEQEYKREIEINKTKLEEALETINTLKKEKQQLEQQLSAERAAIELNKRKCSLQSLQGKGDSFGNVGKVSPAGTRNTSPTISVGRASLSESLGSSVFLQVVEKKRINYLLVSLFNILLKQLNSLPRLD
ncbi:TATA element modulatory factor isoform X1 [Agrilus planipennis]|uniref:TATA element modulatory factor isoform X1 n=1 Tax=Agrilus planipennis TaxID=224129 RepID=A0A7F5RNV2_AGRPL|nr:TATA element modulatory factor isoform X1 [Agrilus planipennis]